MRPAGGAPARLLSCLVSGLLASCGGWTYLESRQVPAGTRVDTMPPALAGSAAVTDAGLDFTTATRCERDLVQQVHLFAKEEFVKEPVDGLTLTFAIMGLASGAGAGLLAYGVSFTEKTPHDRDLDRGIAYGFWGLTAASVLVVAIAYAVNIGRTREISEGLRDGERTPATVPCPPPPAVLHLEPPWGGRIDAPFADVAHFGFAWDAAASDRAGLHDVLAGRWTVAADGWSSASFALSAEDVARVEAQLRR